ncbi:MAG TPA: hypothetical protein PL125_01625 [Candidatus Omnitrophota bacterium]|nr:hypothetical protein [Candidatus Omnitrophota bacterium]HPT38885.1 hypothetical protein [Candidatus Omnitrophota bacterium]
MLNLNLPVRLKREVAGFIQSLEKIYGADLLSVALYGTAASGEFVMGHSNLNILVILRSTELVYLKQAAKTVKKYRNLKPLFLTREYILASVDVFPIEFLDLKENHIVLTGQDFLNEIHIDLKNLRFQCEQELKVKLLNLKQLYLVLNSRPGDLKILLFKTFNSTLHILRNILRLKNIQPLYKKEGLVKQLTEYFKIDTGNWEIILSAKSKKMRLKKSEIERLFIVFVDNLEKIVQTVDAL